jgi:hypothetical protein
MLSLQKANNLLKILTYHLSKGNFSFFLCELLDRFPHSIIKFNYYTLMVVRDVKKADRISDSFTFLWANIDDLPEVSELTGFSLVDLEKRLSSGDFCYIARDRYLDNKLVHVRWIHCGFCYIKGLGYKLNIDEKSAYIYWGFTHSVARANGLSTASVYNISNALKQKNIYKIYGFIDNCNTRSYEHHINCNFKPVSTVWYIKTLFKNFHITYDLLTYKYSISLSTGVPPNYPTI